jgi:hypothetical protein
MESIEIKYKTNFFSKVKKIAFTENALSVYRENKLLIQIEKEDIKDCRYGISWIRGIEFYIGRMYCIDISNGNGKVIKIRLKSVYGIHRRILDKKYNDLLNSLYHFYLDEKISNLIANINDGIEVAVAGIVFRREGVCLDVKKSDGFVEWNDLNTRAYGYYYTLSSKKKPEFYKAFTYLTDWNAVLVYSISREILKDKGLYND